MTYFPLNAILVEEVMRTVTLRYVRGEPALCMLE